MKSFENVLEIIEKLRKFSLSTGFSEINIERQKDDELSCLWDIKIKIDESNSFPKEKIINFKKMIEVDFGRPVLGTKLVEKDSVIKFVEFQIKIE